MVLVLYIHDKVRVVGEINLGTLRWTWFRLQLELHLGSSYFLTLVQR